MHAHPHTTDRICLLDLPNELLVKILRYALVSSKAITPVERLSEATRQRRGYLDHRHESQHQQGDGRKSTYRLPHGFRPAGDGVPSQVLLTCKLRNALGSDLLYANNAIDFASRGYLDALCRSHLCQSFGSHKASLVTSIAFGSPNCYQSAIAQGNSSYDWAYVRNLDMKWATLWGKKGFAINFKSYKMSFPNAKKVAIETTLRAWGLCNGSSSDVRDPSKLNAEQFKELVQMAKDHDFELVTFRTRQQQDGDGVALDVLAGTLSLIERGTTLRQIPI